MIRDSQSSLSSSVPVRCSSCTQLPEKPATRWLGIAFVLAVHGLAIWVLMAQRLLPMPDEAVTLMVNFIAPPAPQQAAPKPLPKRPEPKLLPKEPPRQLVAQAPVLSPAEPVAPPAPVVPVIESVPAVPAMPLPVGPVALGGELSVVCPERQAPDYPTMSRRLGETGKVVLRVTLNAQGRVARATVSQGSGFNRLDEAALAAVRDWRCTPPQRNGQAVEATALQPFNFVLEG